MPEVPAVSKKGARKSPTSRNTRRKAIAVKTNTCPNFAVVRYCECAQCTLWRA